MHFFKDVSRKINLALHESLKMKITELLDLPKNWLYLGHSGEDEIMLEKIELTTWGIYPPFIQVRYRLILESLQTIDARLDAGNKDQLDDTDIVNLIKIAECTLISAPQRSYDQVASFLEPTQAAVYKKASESIEQKFSQPTMKIGLNFFKEYMLNSNPYRVLTDNVKKNILKQANPADEDPDMYLTSRISSAIYKML